MRTRVIINGRFLAQVQTGVQRYALETLRALDQLLAQEPSLREQFEFVLALPATALPHLPALYHVRAEPLQGGDGHRWEQVALARFCKGAYLVNFNYSGPLFKRHQLVTVHDATVMVMPQAFTRSYRWVHQALVAVLGRTARDVMTVSAFSRDELARCFGLRRQDILVGREGGEHALRSADDEQVLRKHGLTSGGYLLGVGSLKANKNFGLLGRAMRLLPDFPLPVAIAGAKDIGIFNDPSLPQENFRFLGFVPDDDLSALYRHAAWFVFPSLYEGFGLPAIEAMAHGCPVLAARAASIPEVCGDAALYFDPQDPADLARLMQHAVTHPGLRAQLLGRAPARLQIYNWRANAELLVQHLQRRLRGGAPRVQEINPSPQVASAISARTP